MSSTTRIAVSYSSALYDFHVVNVILGVRIQVALTYSSLDLTKVSNDELSFVKNNLLDIFSEKCPFPFYLLAEHVHQSLHVIFENCKSLTGPSGEK